MTRDLLDDMVQIERVLSNALKDGSELQLVVMARMARDRARQAIERHAKEIDHNA
jgi:hypothetical protein